MRAVDVALDVKPHAFVTFREESLRLKPQGPRTNPRPAASRGPPLREMKEGLGRNKMPPQCTSVCQETKGQAEHATIMRNPTTSQLTRSMPDFPSSLTSASFREWGATTSLMTLLRHGGALQST